MNPIEFLKDHLILIFVAAIVLAAVAFCLYNLLRPK